MLYFGSSLCAVLGVGWAVTFALRGSWFVVGLELASIAAALIAVKYARQGRLRLAARVLLTTLYLLVLFGTLVLDLPTQAAPRSMHQFFLSLGLASYVLLRDERQWMRDGVPALFLATYAFFACTSFGFQTSYALPDAVRIVGVWVNQAFAVVIVYVSVRLLQTDVAERTQLETELRDAHVRGEMQLHFQPQVDAEGRVVGAEALLRWQHPRRGMVSPAEFIPLAERRGLMLPLGDWVLRTACSQLVTWSSHPELATLKLAINVSASQFVEPDFVSLTLETIKQSGAQPSRLKLELTESMLAHDIDDMISKMAALKSHGIGFSLDDFGTGFSSLTYLRRLPLDQLKIDQAFVRNLLSSPADAAIATAVVQLGHSLGMEVIAEGVETEEQRQFLAGMGCLVYQGYLFSKPLPAGDFEQLVSLNPDRRFTANSQPARVLTAASGAQSPAHQ